MERDVLAVLVATHNFASAAMVVGTLASAYSHHNRSWRCPRLIQWRVALAEDNLKKTVGDMAG